MKQRYNLTLNSTPPASTPSTLLTLSSLSRRQFVTGLAAATATGLLSGCIATNKATGRTSYTGSYSPADEVALGKGEHPKLLEQFGGQYENRRLNRYVKRIGSSLAGHTEYRDQFPYQFTVLNTPIVNAFALPGGYVYISRGLLALASNEAEMAGVLAHELGHVNARHSAERISAQQAAQVGTLLAAIGLQLAGMSSDLARAGQTIATMAIQGYSRRQEFEADTLGVRYMSRAGYDPDGMVTFLSTLHEQSVLEAQAKGLPAGSIDQYNMMSTHPRTVDRVQEATAAANVSRQAQAKLLTDEYLTQIDGMLFGDDPAEGIVEGQRFVHPGMRFEFTAPPGFRLFNSPNNVLAQGPNGATVVFDMASVQRARDVNEYVQREWAPEAQLNEVEDININGFRAATGLTRATVNNKSMDARLLALSHDRGSVFRLLFLSPPATTRRLREPFQRMTYSFKRLSQAQAEAVKPLRLRVRPARNQDRVRNLASTLPYGPQNENWFRVLNDLGPGAEPQNRQKLKIVSS
jgi:predicted Zn-dependent protease